MLTNKEITRQARECLQGKWGFMALVTFIYAVIMGGLNFVFFVGTAGTYLIAGAMGVGYFSLNLKIARNQEYDLSQLFSGFKIFVKSLLMYLLVLIFVCLWSLLLLVPGIVAMFRYSFVYLVATDQPELSALQILARSQELTDGYKWQIFCLALRFLGWFILSIMSFGIGFFWSVPYFNQSITQLYLEVLQIKRCEVVIYGNSTLKVSTPS